MRVLEFSPVMLSPLAKATGRNASIGGGWVESLIRAMRIEDDSLQFCVLCLGLLNCDVVVDGIRYVSTPLNVFEATAKKLIGEFKPNLIHINGAEFFYAAMPMEVYGGVSVVVSIQGIINGYMPHYNGGLTSNELKGTNFTLRYLLRRTSILGDQKEWYRKRAPQEEKAMSQHRYYSGRTEWDHAWVRYFNPSAKYFTVNETLRDPFYKVRRDPSKTIRHSIFCGGAAGYPLKGVHWLIRAVSSLRKEFPDIQLRIAAAREKIDPNRSLMARLKDDPYAIYLRRLIRELDAQRNVVGLPSLHAEEVAKELQSAELFVLPSLCENSPNSLGEAMLVGTPSIATFTGGTPSILKDGVEGKLVPSSDPSALADAIRRWFNHPEEAETCVEPARMTATARHDGANNAKTMLKVFKEVLNASV